MHRVGQRFFARCALRVHGGYPARIRARATRRRIAIPIHGRDQLRSRQLDGGAARQVRIGHVMRQGAAEYARETTRLAALSPVMAGRRSGHSLFGPFHAVGESGPIAAGVGHPHAFGMIPARSRHLDLADRRAAAARSTSIPPFTRDWKARARPAISDAIMRSNVRVRPGRFQLVGQFVGDGSRRPAQRRRAGIASMPHVGPYHPKTGAWDGHKPQAGVGVLAGVRGSRTLRRRRRQPASGFEVREAHRDPSTPAFRSHSR